MPVSISHSTLNGCSPLSMKTKYCDSHSGQGLSSPEIPEQLCDARASNFPTKGKEQ